jgi:hypothetical protein
LDFKVFWATFIRSKLCTKWNLAKLVFITKFRPKRFHKIDSRSIFPCAKLTYDSGEVLWSSFPPQDPKIVGSNPRNEQCSSNYVFVPHFYNLRTKKCKNSFRPKLYICTLFPYSLWNADQARKI